MKKDGICLAFFIRIELDSMASTNPIKIRQTLLESTANVIVLLVSLLYVEFIMFFFAIFEMPAKIWIVSSTFLKVLNTVFPQNRIIFNGILALSIQHGEIPGFREFLYSLNPSKCKDAILFPNISEQLSDCELSNTIPCRTDVSLPKCTESQSFTDYGLSLNDTMNLRISYGVYTAVYTMALALHKLYNQKSRTSNPDRKGRQQSHFKQWQLNAIIRNTVFEMTSGEKVHFKYPSNHYEILKWFFLEERDGRTVKVGSIDTSKPIGNMLYINDSADLWGPYFTKNNTLSDPDFIILQCNEGSGLFFFCIIGYIGTMALLIRKFDSAAFSALRQAAANSLKSEVALRRQKVAKLR
ncbi:hypothetical protein XELAEV_18028355mg [Xenopus laevis]|uniref:Receptor ligand binding region domain-containing protein n=1 Tax=Xenopus laevis TaxID=8355 RepID=A0A974CY21_XENLA|nr:hypothetical protein XELAEV_18028355mg [Xenopus laevis]